MDSSSLRITKYYFDYSKSVHNSYVFSNLEISIYLSSDPSILLSDLSYQFGPKREQDYRNSKILLNILYGCIGLIILFLFTQYIIMRLWKRDYNLYITQHHELSTN